MPYIDIIKKIFLIILVACWSKNASAQMNAYNFEKLTTANGLSSNKVTSMLQDRDGFYWIGTADGLNRFDGTSFKIFRNNKKDSSSLINNYCTYLLEDDKGDIWVATYTGISVFRKKKESFENYTVEFPGIDKSLINRINSLAKDKDGNIWMSCYYIWKFNNSKNKFVQMPMPGYALEKDFFSISYDLVYDSLLNGLWFRDGKTIHFFDIMTNELNNFYNNRKGFAIFDKQLASPLTLDNKQRLWFNDDSTRKLCAYDTKKNRIIETTLSSLKHIRRIKGGHDDKLWISFWHGHSAVYDIKKDKADSNIFKSLHPYSSSADHFTDFFLDSDSALWFGSSTGINILRANNQFYEVYTLNENPVAEGHPPYRISAIAKKNDTVLFVGTNTGLYYYNIMERKYRKIHVSGLSSVRCLYYSTDRKQLWIGAADKIILFDALRMRFDKTLQSVLYPSFILSHKNDMWIGTWLNGMYRLNREGKIMEHFSREDPVHFMKTDGLITGYISNNELWVGLNGGNGLAKHDISGSSFHFFEIGKGPEVYSSVGTITAIASDKKNNLWIGSHGGGLYYWDRSKDHFIQQMQSDGLRSNFIYNIVITPENDLWISHSNGVDYFLSSSQKFIPLEFELPFPNNDYHNSAYLADDGNLFFFNANTIIRIRSPFNRKYNANPKLIISSLKVFDKEIPYENFRNGISLSYKKNFFTIEFSKLKTNPSEYVQYAYMLDGFDKGWNYPGGWNFASYTNVPGGKYVFRLKVMNYSGEWNEKELTMKVSIKPPFWKTGWFVILAILFISGALYLFYRYRINYLKRIMALRTKISQDLHDEVGSTLSSIHIFSSVANKALEKDPEQARDALLHIHKNTRQVMENMSDIVWAINTSQIGETTFEIKLKNFGYELLSPLNIQCHYKVDREADSKLVNLEARKNMLLIAKEALNNVAKYSKATRAEVNVTSENGSLVLIINDNGIGFDPKEKHSGNGLHNMKIRTEALGGVFSYETGAGKGTSVICKIPLTNISE